MIYVMPNSLRRKIRKHRPVMWSINALGILLFVFVVFTIAHKMTEGGSWEVAFWMSWQTFSTVGYGDSPASTTLGRSMTMFFGTINIIVMSAVIGIIISLVEYLLMRRRKGLVKNPFKDGYVLIQFPGANPTEAFVREIRAKEPDIGICIVDSMLEELPADVANMDKMHFIRGSALKPDTYVQARLKEAKAIIVFPKDRNDTDSDGNTKVVVDLVVKYTESKVKLLYVLVDDHNEHMFQGLPATRVLEHLEILSLVQECQDNASALIIERLLRNTEGAAPNTVLQTQLTGWTWKEFLEACMSVPSVRMNPLALMRGRDIQLSPPLDHVIEKGDALSLVAFSGFNWKSFEDALCVYHNKKK